MNYFFIVIAAFSVAFLLIRGWWKNQDTNRITTIVTIIALAIFASKNASTELAVFLGLLSIFAVVLWPVLSGWYADEIADDDTPDQSSADRYLGGDYTDTHEYVFGDGDHGPSNKTSRQQKKKPKPSPELMFGNHSGVVTIYYTNGGGEDSEREISNIAFSQNRHGQNIITAFCHLRRAVRTFTVDRISYVQTDAGELVDPYVFFDGNVA